MKQLILFRMFITILTLLFLSKAITAKEVCLFTLESEAEKVDGKTLHVPFNTVAMSGDLKVDIPSAVKKSATGKASVMFVIDNSGSMHNFGKDQMGSRFTVAKAFIDSLYEMNPKIEVGLTVFASHLWFDKNDDPLFEEVTEFGGFTDGYDKGAYLPLLKLNGDYSGKSGREVLHHYLQTDTFFTGNSINYVTTKYAPSTFKPEKGTNISLAFDAAKSAMKNAENPKHKQFIIFLSDGEPSVPQTGYKELFARGENTPCTFTIYFTPSGEVPLILDRMTTNIQTNGFSSANPGSSITPLETNHDALLDYIMENIFDQIIKSTKSGTPLEIDINGLSNSKWEGGFFSFPDLFPLEKKSTPFSFSIDYNIVHDSITEDGDTIHLGAYDTTTTSNFVIDIESGTTGDDALTYLYWDREIVIRQNGDIKNLLKESEPVTLEFVPSPIDTLIEYADVSLLVKTVISKDEESFDLSKNSTLFDVLASLEIRDANSGDGTIQVAREDTLCIYFQNKDLPLDTLSYKIPFTQKEEITLSEVVYFDSTADGKIDHISFQFIGDSDDSIYRQAVDSLVLPDERQFIRESMSVNDGMVTLKVIESSPEIRTACHDFDFVYKKDSLFLYSGVVLLPTEKLAIKDSLAPVIVIASVHDSLFYEKHGTKTELLQKGEDYLTIQFSEEVEAVKDAKPFDFYMVLNNTLYELELEEAEKSGKSHRFLIKSNDAIVEGDSVHISTGSVKDLVGNRQDSPQNIKRVLDLDSTVHNEYRSISLEKAVAFDRNADGFMDSLLLTFDQDEIPFYADYIIKELTLPEWRKLEQVQKGDVGDTWLALSVEEGQTNATTSIESGDTVTIENMASIHEGTKLNANSVVLIDSMAPVVLEATLKRDETLYLVGGKDSLVENSKPALTILFSEPIDKGFSNTPFTLYRTVEEDHLYDAFLGFQSSSDNYYAYTVDSITTFDTIYEDDSIHIRWEGDTIVSDTSRVAQQNDENVKVPIQLDVEKDTIVLRLPFTLEVFSTILDREKSLSNEEFFASFTAFSHLFEKDEPSLLVLQLRPDPVENVTEYDSYSASVVLMDPVGNIILDRQECVYDEDSKSLFWLWNGVNQQGRECGAGTYAALISITYFLNGNPVLMEEVKHMIGIKNKKGTKE